jgi:hypothetical protein
MRIHTTHSRDAALRELNRITRWLIAGSIVLTGVLSDVAASAFSGKSTKHSTKAKSASVQHKTHKHSGGTSTGVLKPPAQAPTTPSEQPPSQEPAPQSQESAPSDQSAPAQEPAPPQESAPAQESAPTHEATPEPAPAQEATPEPAPTQESGPVVSGGS